MACVCFSLLLEREKVIKLQAGLDVVIKWNADFNSLISVFACKDPRLKANLFSYIMASEVKVVSKATFSFSRYQNQFSL